MNLDREKIAQLGINFLVIPSKSRFVAEEKAPFELLIEANVLCTDGEVLDRRHRWQFGFLKRTKAGVFLHFEEFGATRKRIRVYTEYRSKPARVAIRKIEERVTSIVAPKYWNEIRSLEVAIEMFEEIHRQITVHTVLDS